MYASLAERHGAPRAVLSDGAAELHDGAEILKKSRPDAIVLGDFKHRAANVLKSIVGGDPRFAEFQTHVGRTRSAIQLERQHSKSGFASLIATFASLLRPATPATIRSALDRVKVKDVREWLQKNLPKTLTAKRLTTYREFNATQARATKTPATT